MSADLSRRDQSSIRVLVVDDHDVFRRGIVSLLRDEGIDVVGEASGGTAAVRLASELCPDVVLMDISMPGLDGLQATRAIVGSDCDASVVIFTISQHEELIMEALLAGAAGYVGKDEPVELIVSAIAAAAVGDALIPQRVASEVLHRLRDQPGARVTNDDTDLSKREREVLRLMADGKDNMAIADELTISPHTVKNHVTSIFAKLGVNSRLQACVQALRRGLIR